MEPKVCVSPPEFICLGSWRVWGHQSPRFEPSFFSTQALIIRWEGGPKPYMPYMFRSEHGAWMVIKTLKRLPMALIPITLDVALPADSAL